MSRRLLFIALLMLCQLPAQALEQAGQVIFVAGKVSVERPESIALKKTDLVYEGDVVVVAPKSRGQLLMKDGAKFSLRPNTRFAVEEYFLAGEERETGGAVVVASNNSAVTSLIQGGFRTISGAIGKDDPEEYKVKSPAATMGIRGTHYSAVWCSGDCPVPEGTEAPPDGLYVGVTDGEVSLTNLSGEYSVRAGQYYYVQNFESKPIALPKPPAILGDSGDGAEEEEDEEDEESDESDSEEGEEGEEGDESDSDEGDESDSDESDSDEGDSGSDEGDSGSDEGDSGSDEGDSGSGDSESGSGDGDSGSESGDGDSGDTTAGSGGSGGSSSSDESSAQSAAAAAEVAETAAALGDSAESVGLDSGSPDGIPGSGSIDTTGATAGGATAGGGGTTESADSSETGSEDSSESSSESSSEEGSGETVASASESGSPAGSGSTDSGSSGSTEGSGGGSVPVGGSTSFGTGFGGDGSVGGTTGPGGDTGAGTPSEPVIPIMAEGGAPLESGELPSARSVALGSGPVTGLSSTVFTNASRMGTRTFVGNDLTGFQSPPTSEDSAYAIGTAPTTIRDDGFHPPTGIGWGRWAGGTATVTQPTGTVININLAQQSLHFVYGPVAPPVIPTTGSANFSLIVGNTDPTDTLGNSGVLGSANLSANFTNATVQSALALSINGSVWEASGNGSISNTLFNGLYNSVIIGGQSGGSGNFSGFFGSAGNDGLPAGAGLTYGLSNPQGGSVSGAVVFGQPNP